VRQPYPWLKAYLDAHLDELEGLRSQDLKNARGWFQSLLKYFRRRNLSTPRAAEELSRGRAQRYQEGSGAILDKCMHVRNGKLAHNWVERSAYELSQQLKQAPN
jgi:hypothetical protein